MDLNDVSATPQYAQSLVDRRRHLQDAQARKGQRPARMPRTQVIVQFQLQLMRPSVRQHELEVKTSFVPPPYPPCVEPFSNLKKTMIDDLLLETHHRGTYLLVRSVTPQDWMTAVMAIVEDEKGDVLMVQMYHQKDNADSRTEDIISVGGVLILKEPYLKQMSDGNYGLRVDHLSDVLFLAENDERIPSAWQREPAEQNRTALAWKTEGNSHFKRSAYRSAIECYTRALGCSTSPEETQTIRLNRALAFLKTRQHDAALSDVESATAAGDKPAEKALYRKAEALYGLQQYRECCEVLKELRLAYPDNVAAKSQLTHAISRLAEHNNGKYQFKQLRDKAASARPPHLDHATYMGPVRVQASGARGRGLFTTKAVKAGDLLFCEKAYTHAFFDKDGGHGGHLTILVDPEDGGTMGSQSDLIDMTIQKLHRNPSLIPTITDLHHGSYQPVDATHIDGEPVVDTFLIRRIISLNCFGCPQVSTLTSHQKMQHQGRSHPTKPFAPDESNGFHSCGLWPTASYINHSCTSNARRAFIGDMLIARATRDLPANTEITWWYQPPNSAERNKTLLRQWGFVCDCPLCEDEKSTSAAVLGKREVLTAGLRKQIASLRKGGGKKETGVAVAKIDAALDALAATYTRPASEVPRLAVWAVMQNLLMAVVGLEQVPMARKVKLLLAMLRSLGYVIEGGVGGTLKVQQWGLMMDGVVECWAFLRDAYRLTAPELVVPAEGYARTAYRMVFGEDETFDMYGE